MANLESIHRLLDDCHTALSKSTMPIDEYNKISRRLVETKMALIKEIVNEEVFEDDPGDADDDVDDL